MGDEVKIYRRFFFEDESAEDQDVHFGFNKECDFPMFNGQSIRGRFERDGWTKIVGNEGDLKVCYQIQEGKLVETITGNGYTSYLCPHPAPRVAGLRWYKIFCVF